MTSNLSKEVAESEVGVATGW